MYPFPNTLFPHLQQLPSISETLEEEVLLKWMIWVMGISFIAGTSSTYNVSPYFQYYHCYFFPNTLYSCKGSMTSPPSMRIFATGCLILVVDSKLVLYVFLWLARPYQKSPWTANCVFAQIQALSFKGCHYYWFFGCLRNESPHSKLLIAAPSLAL